MSNSETFLDDQVVTAQDLNNIAVDLGYADYSHFPETPPQSAVSALNQITKDLVTDGILQTGNNCAVSLSSGKARIDTGVIVFDSGAKKRIEEAVLIDLMSSGTSCIYALNDTVNNAIKIVCAAEFQTSGDFIKLAKIENSTVTDMRQFATAKVAFATPAVTQSIGDVELPSNVSSQDYVLIATKTIASESFTYLLCEQKYGGRSYYENGYHKFDENGEIYFSTAKIKRNGKIIEFYHKGGGYNTDLKNIVLI